MKYRSSFVSNSSSTSFTFISKEDNLSILIKKYHQYFDLYFITYDNKEFHITVDDVVNSIEELKKKLEGEAYYKHIKIKYNIDEYIEVLEERSKEYIKYLEKEREYIRENPRQSNYKYLMDKFMDTGNEINRLKELKEKGFKFIYLIGFGDNHGEISGLGVGEVMDYEGRKININKPDFVVYTEQDR